MTASDPRPLSAADLDEMDRLARAAIDAATAYYALPEDTWDREAPEADALAKADAEFIARCTPSRITSLVALARRGAEDTARLDHLDSLPSGITINGDARFPSCSITPKERGFSHTRHLIDMDRAARAASLTETTEDTTDG